MSGPQFWNLDVLEFGNSALDQICWFLLKENYVLKITHGTLKYEEK